MAQRAATASFMVKMILGDINQKSMLMRSGNAMAARSEKGRLPHSSPRDVDLASRTLVVFVEVGTPRMLAYS